MSENTLFAFGVEQRPTSPVRLAHLDKLCASLRAELKRPLVCLEIGALFGESANILAKYGPVTSIDPWPGDSLDIFRKNTKGLDICPVRGFSQEILCKLPPGRYDLAYIDGDHRWPVPFFDMEWCKILVRKGGVICGDDFEKPVTNFDTRPNPTVDFKDGYHPGVSFAIFLSFPSVNSQDGFWWVRNQ